MASTILLNGDRWWGRWGGLPRRGRTSRRTVPVGLGNPNLGNQLFVVQRGDIKVEDTL
ncbi:hypothetical protein GCM10009839_65400 [Catenulispora yoronensis]|uniref:Uncharacterized protein n=1 Tax=Catenulispora yoronensis TaxID=450799 RepID=A0ABP5GTE9_9ACTN